MSVALTYVLILVAFFAVCAMCMEISVRKRRAEQPPPELRDGRRIDPASVTPPGRLGRAKNRKRDTMFVR